MTAIGVQEAGGLRPYTPEDVSKLTGRRPSGELAGDLNEDEFKRAAATLGEFKECGLRCCCTAFTTLTALFGQVRRCVDAMDIHDRPPTPCAFA